MHVTSDSEWGKCIPHVVSRGRIYAIYSTFTTFRAYLVKMAFSSCFISS